MKRLRLFVAAYPPPEVAERALEAVRSLELPPHRLTPAEQVHLTIHFVGEVDPRSANDIEDSVAHGAKGLAPMTLTPRRLIGLPPRGKPRLVALETDAPPGLLELKRRLARSLARKPRKDPADRFTPHLTLCRYRDGKGPRVDEPVELPPFGVERVALVRSALRPDGAEHRTVREVALAG